MKQNSKIKKILGRPRSRINSLRGREILDSRGNPTVEIELKTDFGIFRASVPSGVSKGKYEAVELRDGGGRYHGRGVLKAVKNVNEIIAPKLKGKDPTRQKELDDLMRKLDGTVNKSKLGANAILAVSVAVCRAGATAKNLPLYQHIRGIGNWTPPTHHPLEIENFKMPTPSVLMIEGGAHAGSELDFQEFMIVPQEKIFSKNLQKAVEIYQELKNLIKEKYVDSAINVGDEGGFTPSARAPEEVLSLILGAAKNLGYQNKIKIILDIAASQFYTKGTYKMRIGAFTREGLLNYYSDLIQKYPIIGLEDPFSEDDWQGWRKLKIKSEKLKVLIIGDDLLATNLQRMKMAREGNACNAAIIKPNQIGTVSETIEAIKLAKSYGWEIIVSHRSGETCDDFISDLAVGIGADYIKAGAPARGERAAKYNRLLRIEEETQ